MHKSKFQYRYSFKVQFNIDKLNGIGLDPMHIGNLFICHTAVTQNTRWLGKYRQKTLPLTTTT